MSVKIDGLDPGWSAPAHGFEDLGFLGFWSWDFATDRIRGSEAIADLFGICVETCLAGAPTSAYRFRIHPDDVAWVAEERARSFGPSGHGVVEYRMLDATGTVRWVMCRGRYETDEQGALVRAHGLLIDITAFKADGNSNRTVPAPFADPVKALVDAALAAHAAALQIGHGTPIRQAEAMLLHAGRLLAQDLAGGCDRSVH